MPSTTRTGSNGSTPSTRESLAAATDRDRQEQVEGLTSEAFFFETERKELSERLVQTEEALTEALSADRLDAADDLLG